jgi:hypothetical protein
VTAYDKPWRHIDNKFYQLGKLVVQQPHASFYSLRSQLHTGPGCSGCSILMGFCFVPARTCLSRSVYYKIDFAYRICLVSTPLPITRSTSAFSYLLRPYLYLLKPLQLVHIRFVEIYNVCLFVPSQVQVALPNVIPAFFVSTPILRYVQLRLFTVSSL